MQFEFKLGGKIVGFSELEGGDAPWASHTSGSCELPPMPRSNHIALNVGDAWVSIPGLTVSLAGGAPIECSGGIQIIDLSPELGDAGIQVHLNGVTNPPYAELFPHHVEAYKQQFE